MFYVTMTDKCLSGWGMAQGNANKLVISCNSMDEALTVERNAQRRHEMKYINIVSKKPYYNKKYYYTSYHGKSEGDYESWFTDHLEWS